MPNFFKSHTPGAMDRALDEWHLADQAYKDLEDLQIDPSFVMENADSPERFPFYEKPIGTTADGQVITTRAMNPWAIRYMNSQAARAYGPVMSQGNPADTLRLNNRASILRYLNALIR